MRAARPPTACLVRFMRLGQLDDDELHRVSCGSARGGGTSIAALARADERATILRAARITLNVEDGLGSALSHGVDLQRVTLHENKQRPCDLYLSRSRWRHGGDTGLGPKCKRRPLGRLIDWNCLVNLVAGARFELTTFRL